MPCLVNKILQRLEGAVKWLIPCTRVLEVCSRLFWHQMHAWALRMPFTAACLCRGSMHFVGLQPAGPISQLPAMLLPAGICWELQTMCDKAGRWSRWSCRLLDWFSDTRAGCIYRLHVA